MTTNTSGPLPRAAADEIPVISVVADCLPQAWEQAMLAVWDRGFDVKTQYDKPEDPPSKDATVMIAVTDPFREPRIHKNFPGGPEELEAYRQEVVGGIHDHWIDPAAGKWTYTYHERLFAYRPVEDLRRADGPRPFAAVNQVQYIIDALARAGHTRRAQAVTWMPTADPQTYDPPCLQRLWFRLLPDEQGVPVLNLNTSWRSRDAYKAWFMNVYALTDLQRVVAQRISKKIKQPVRVGRYVDQSDSFHIYGSYFKDVLPEIEKMKDGCYEKRSWPSDHPAFRMLVEETSEKLAKNRDYMRGD